ncbi:MAG: RNA polymerase sigma factor [Anaerolineae bacterium]|nr:RNA polymerase sigma factor [Anaerolineae bacterium]
MLDNLDEQELVRRAVDDLDAFQQLYHRYFQRVYGYVASRIEDQREAEDLVSEIFLRVIKNLTQLRNERHISFAAWLFVIARHAITDHYRRNGRSETPMPLDAAENLVAAEPKPDEMFIDTEEAAKLYQMILTLSERKREIITLRYYGGLRNHEIAVVLGIGEKTVSAYLSRALQELRQQYAVSQRQDE